MLHIQCKMNKLRVSILKTKIYSSPYYWVKLAYMMNFLFFSIITILFFFNIHNTKSFIYFLGGGGRLGEKGKEYFLYVVFINTSKAVFNRKYQYLSPYISQSGIEQPTEFVPKKRGGWYNSSWKCNDPQAHMLGWSEILPSLSLNQSHKSFIQTH